jgi:hypothetical protein
MDTLQAQAVEFITGEFLPTLAALTVTAGREPMTWAVLAAWALGRVVWRRLQGLS